MHEIGIVRQLLRTVTAFAEGNGIEEIHEVVRPDVAHEFQCFIAGQLFAVEHFGGVGDG